MHWLLGATSTQKKVRNSARRFSQAKPFHLAALLPNRMRKPGIVDARVAVRHIGTKESRAQPFLPKRKHGVAQKDPHMLRHVPPPPSPHVRCTSGTHLANFQNIEETRRWAVEGRNHAVEPKNQKNQRHLIVDAQKPAVEPKTPKKQKKYRSRDN